MPEESSGGSFCLTLLRDFFFLLNPVSPVEKPDACCFSGLMPAKCLGRFSLSRRMESDRVNLTRFYLCRADSARYLRCVLLRHMGFYQHKLFRVVLPVCRRRLCPDLIQLTNALMRGFNWQVTLLEKYTDDDLPSLNLDGEWPGVEAE